MLYDTSQSFARAFRAATNYSPSEIRIKPGALDRAIEKLSVPAGTPRLESSGYWLRSAPLYNHYVQDPDSVPAEEWETDIYLPIQEGNNI